MGLSELSRIIALGKLFKEPCIMADRESLYDKANV
jgi:hypothetical protein